jgi:hypothetical protein
MEESEAATSSEGPHQDTSEPLIEYPLMTVKPCTHCPASGYWTPVGNPCIGTRFRKGEFMPPFPPGAKCDEAVDWTGPRAQPPECPDHDT